MPVENRKSEVLCELEKRIANRGRIVLLDIADREVLVAFCEETSRDNNSDVEVWQWLEEKPKADSLKYITKEDMNEVTMLYREYHFSDKCILVTETTQYATLQNYVDNRILTIQEMVGLILCKT